MKTAVIRTVVGVACVGSISLVSGAAGASRQFTDFMDRVYPEFMWMDAAGGNKTSLTMGQKSFCAGPLVGTEYTISDCSFLEGSGTVANKRVKTQWKFAGGEGQSPIRETRLINKTQMKLRVRLIADDGSYDCTSSVFALSFGGTLTNVPRTQDYTGTETLLQQEAGLRFNESATCKVDDVKQLGELFGKLVDFKKPSLRGW